MPTTVELQINGQPQTLKVGTTLADWLAQVQLSGKRVACELNQELVPRSAWSTTVLQAGDRLEIVTAIGGG